MDFISGSIDFSKGTNERIINTKNEISFIPIICYEIIFFWKLINKENNYSNLLINITNDFWFGDYIGPYQHFYLSKLRAAEFNKNLIRVSNNGISSIIDNNGNILVSSELNKKDKLNYKLLINDEKNLIILHKILGYILTIFCFISLFVLKLKDE
jgi:Apolipoprotein N-acyltransferase